MNSEIIFGFAGLILGLFSGVVGIAMTIFTKESVKNNQKLLWILEEMENKVVKTGECSGRTGPVRDYELPHGNDFLNYSVDVQKGIEKLLKVWSKFITRLQNEPGPFRQNFPSVFGDVKYYKYGLHSWNNEFNSRTELWMTFDHNDVSPFREEFLSIIQEIRYEIEAENKIYNSLFRTIKNFGK